VNPGVVAAVASSLAVVVALVFGTLTIRQWQRTRYLSAAAEMVRMVLTPEFTRAIARVVELPEKAALEGMATPELLHAITVVTHGFEGLGVLVFHRLLPLHLVDHLVGGYVRAAWKRLQPYVESRRESLGPMFGEWFQWLAERLEEDPAPGKNVGAYLAHKTWRR
jgi:hypothetical protein